MIRKINNPFNADTIINVEEIFKVLFSLSNKGKDIYIYLVQYIIANGEPKELIEISYKKLNKYYLLINSTKPLSLRGYDDAIRELISKNIIDLQDREANLYWVNQNYF